MKTLHVKNGRIVAITTDTDNTPDYGTRYDVADNYIAAVGDVYVPASQPKGAPLVSLSSPRTNIQPPDIADTFDSFVTRMELTRDFVFGTAPGRAGATRLANVRDLSTFFNPYEDFTGDTVINSELQRYQPFSASENFVFNDNGLELRAVLQPNQDHTAIGPLRNAAAGTNTTTMVLPDTTGIVPGMYFCQLYNSGVKGRIVTAVSGTTVTFNQAMSYSANQENFFIAFARLTLSATTTASNTLTVTTVLPTTRVGMVLWDETSANGNNYGTTYITAINGNVITLNRNVTIYSGQIVTFVPAVYSAQIWSKDTFRPGRDNLGVVAIEVEVELPALKAYGAWPAVWLYSAQDGTSPQQLDSSEIDLYEGWVQSNKDMHDWTGNNRIAYGSGLPGSGFYAGNFYTRGGPGRSYNPWDPSGFYAMPTGEAMSGPGYKKIQLIWFKDKVYRYTDGVLFKADHYYWSSSNRAQLGINLAVGSLSDANLPNGLFARSNAVFPMAVKVRNVRLWTL